MIAQVSVVFANYNIVYMFSGNIDNIDHILKVHIMKAIMDKNQDKRKFGRNQLEKLVYQHVLMSSPEIIDKLLIFFSQKFVKNTDINKRIVGLEVMTSLIRAIQSQQIILQGYDKKITSVILQCLNDSEGKIRTIAFKSLFEITRILKERVLRLFNIIFQKIIACINDVEDTVRDACSLLNSTLKGIVLNTEDSSQKMNFPEFIDIIKSKLKTMNLQVRKFLILWIRDMMDLDLFVYFPWFLQDLLIMISEKQLEEEVTECLKTFESIIKQKFYDNQLQKIISINYINQIISILIRVAKNKYPSYTKYNTLKWFQLIFLFFKEQVNMASKPNHQFYFKKAILERFDQILEPILLLMSNEEEEVRRQSIEANDLLMQSIRKIERQQPINFVKVIPILKEVLSQKKSTSTSQYAINWMKFMLQDYNDKLVPEIKEIIEKIIEKIYETNSKNINDIIEKMKMRSEYCNLMIEKMLSFLCQKLKENQNRIEFMIKKFISINDSKQFMMMLCQQLKSKDYQENQKFMYEIAFSLNSIIINEEITIDIRRQLNNRCMQSHKQLFMMFYNILKYNPPAVICLCLIAQQYQLALSIINTLTGKYEISAWVLMGLCKLVNLLQKPAFYFLRMQILQDNNEPLLECLNSLLMILPQGKVFNMLRRRLDSANLLIAKHKQVVHEIIAADGIDTKECFRSYLQAFGLDR